LSEEIRLCRADEIRKEREKESKERKGTKGGGFKPPSFAAALNSLSLSTFQELTCKTHAATA